MADDSEKPRNRKTRRAAAKDSNRSISPPTSTPKIKMAKPDYDAKPSGPTLLDIAEKRKGLLDKGQPFDKKYDDGVARDENGNILDAGLGETEPLGQTGNAIFWSLTLTMIHFMLDVLVYSQYRQDILWSAIITRTATAFPVLFALAYLAGSEAAKKLGLFRELVFFAVAVVAGCYTIHVGNRYDYFAVMKQAPPLGTLWIWSVIEMRLESAAASALIDVGFLWWKGYSAF